VRSGVWYLTNAITGNPTPNLAFAYGVAGDLPVAGMWGTLPSAAVPGAETRQQNAFGISSTNAASTPPEMPCARTFSCVAPPDAWYGAKSLADPRGATLRGWTGRPEGPYTQPVMQPPVPESKRPEVQSTPVTPGFITNQPGAQAPTKPASTPADGGRALQSGR
jgi:hypothetical protein